MACFGCFGCFGGGGGLMPFGSFDGLTFGAAVCFAGGGGEALTLGMGVGVTAIGAGA